MASGRLAHSHYDDDAEGGGAPARKKRKVVSARIERPKGVASHFRPADTSQLQEVCVCMFCVCVCVSISCVYKLHYVCVQI